MKRIMDKGDSSDSDYVVDEYLKPDKISKYSKNGSDADILGNFDDSKRDENGDLLCSDNESIDDDDDSGNNYKCSESSLAGEDDSDENVDYNENSNYSIGTQNDDKKDKNDKNEDENKKDDHNKDTDDKKDNDDDDDDNDGRDQKSNKSNDDKKLSSEQVRNLLRGASKKDRYVLYVTNLNYDTTKSDLENLFSNAGCIKGIRIPKKLKNRNNGGYAFVEMSTFDEFNNALNYHNKNLNGRSIKIQISEGGKKKSANKKNILKQKNRKLSNLRKENKSFTKSGKNYNKELKKEIRMKFQKNNKQKWQKKRGSKK